MLRAIILVSILTLPAAAAAQHHGHDGNAPASPTALTEPGQGAFAAIAEVVARLERDPDTDWSRVHLNALREHLLDMDLVTLRSRVSEEPVRQGLAVRVRGDGRIGMAIRRMVLAHARELAKVDGWRVRADERPDGATLTVTSESPRQATRIRGLGFFGLMATGAHHRLHHWMIATGRDPH